jgi:hypothetical protein
MTWGFHFPVETYLDRVHELLNENGSLIIDVRKGSGGLERLSQRFERCDIIQDARNRVRVCAGKTARRRGCRYCRAPLAPGGLSGREPPCHAVGHNSDFGHEVDTGNDAGYFEERLVLDRGGHINVQSFRFGGSSVAEA